MESLTDYILEAAHALWPRLAADPVELAARIQRRHRATLQSPPRDWCIALRANDTRLSPWNTIMDDCHAPAARRAHHITVDAELVRRLVAPVHIHWMGQTPHEIAALLGVAVRNLRNAVDAGVFTRRRIQGLAGKPGKPQPLLSCKTPLDPAGPLYRPPGGYWGHAWQHRGSAFPDAHVQTIERRPHFRPANTVTVYDDEAGDAPVEVDDIGPRRFHDWHWTCPACGRGVRKLYFPLPVPYVETYLNLFTAPGTSPLHEADAPPVPVPTFACEDCHHLTHVDERSYKGWNMFVTYLTCGLLYGHEVKRPQEWPYEMPVIYRKTGRSDIV